MSQGNPNVSELVLLSFLVDGVPMRKACQELGIPLKQAVAWTIKWEERWEYEWGVSPASGWFLPEQVPAVRQFVVDHLARIRKTVAYD